jgi:predicted amidohydrolase YtcJ
MHRPTLCALVTAATLLGPAAPTPAEDAADLVLVRGVFYPVEPAAPVSGSLAVRDGAIVYLGPDEGAAALRGPDTEVVDLAGRAVTPGLIDAHSHLAGLGAALAQVDLVGTGSYAEVVARVAAAAGEQAAGSWVRGRGWDQNDWAEKAFPTHRELTAAVPDHPVWLTRVDGHAALLNAAALAALGIDASTLDPSGGRLLRDDSGTPTGVLIDNAMDLAAGRIAAPPAAEQDRRLAAAAAHAVARGLTTVTDMGVDEATIAAYRRLQADGRLPLRAALFLTDSAPLLADWMARGPEVDPAGRLTVRGVKLYADGALGSRGAALVEPYADDEGNLGLLTASGDHLREVTARALDAGFQVGIHAIGDRGTLVALDAIEGALAAGSPSSASPSSASPSADSHTADPRLRIEHFQVARLQDVVRLGRLGVIASMQPTHATSDMPWAGDRVGEGRLAGAYAWRKVLDAGGRLALGSDFPVERVDPLLGLHAAVTRQDLDGAPAGGWLPGERLDRDEALRGFTLDAAHSLFLDHLVGSLAVGKRADLVVFERDPMTVPAAEIPAVRVDLTVVDGEVVYRRGAEAGR